MIYFYGLEYELKYEDGSELPECLDDLNKEKGLVIRNA